MRISLFSGIGGLELGLERSGIGAVLAQVESNPFCRAVLAKHWPNVDRSVIDVCKATARNLPACDLICGGFPCQDISSAGRGEGLEGQRSGLWFEYLRVIEELRPRCAIVENVASGARRWLPFVRRDLHLLGYDTLACELSAFDVGAPHLRARIFLLAADSKRFGVRLFEQRRPARWSRRVRNEGQAELVYDGAPGTMADTDSVRQPRARDRQRGDRTSVRGDAPHADELGREARIGRNGSRMSADASWWASEPDVGRVAHGVPSRLDRISGLGNAVVPQCAEAIGRYLKDMIEMTRRRGERGKDP